MATVRMVKAALLAPVTGVEAQLDAFLYDGTDTRPEALAAVLDPTADDAVVTQQGILDWPILVVTAEQPTTLHGQGVTGGYFDAPNLLVSVAYATRDTAEPARAWRDTDYTLRAIALALDAGLFASAAGAARVRGSVQIVKRNSMTYGPINLSVPGGKVTGAVLLDLYVRDTTR
ncbi:MAG TPA: hypothetical protein VFW98_08345 [Gemmatimonadaceae bacterium]|nr:hypothetical protein [Gemmatimonadaceae bacterium]